MHRNRIKAILVLIVMLLSATMLFAQSVNEVATGATAEATTETVTLPDEVNIQILFTSDVPCFRS